jgi:hypothetical protein
VLYQFAIKPVSCTGGHLQISQVFVVHVFVVHDCSLLIFAGLRNSAGKGLLADGGVEVAA